MDANTTCGLVTTVPFTSYNQILGSDSSSLLVEFSMAANKVSGKFTSPVNTNDFTTFITTAANFPTGKPVLTKSIVTGYLGYPISGKSFSNDFYTISNTASTVANNPFRNLSTQVQAIIAAGDLCSSSNIYNSNLFTGEVNSSLSLTTLYKTLLQSNLSPTTTTAVQNQIDLLQTKNKMFYAYFVYEYCYYNTMYNTLLNNYFDEYSTTTTVAAFSSNVSNLRDSSGARCTAAATTDAQSKRLDALIIVLARVNSRLTDMRNLLFEIQNYYSGALQQLQLTLNGNSGMGSDSDAESKVTALKNQFPGVEQAKDDSSFRQGIMEYTSEKNRYSNILLGIYAFLNIAIIAVIFNIKE